MLLEPRHTVVAALRLEALGKASVAPLREGLRSEHPLVRFCAAESLTYLGSTAGVEELAGLAARHQPVRAWALMALASLDEAVTREKLGELLAAGDPELRYGAFRALRLLNEAEPDHRVQGDLVNESFWLHRVAPKSPPLVHFAAGQRAEVVLFGEGHYLAPPIKVLAGQEFTVTAEPGDDRCTVGRFMHRQGRIELGAQYPDVVELLRSLDERKGLSCVVRVNALPDRISAEDLHASGRKPEFWQAPAGLPPADGGVRQASYVPQE
jgi:hypothetical protein